MTSFNADGFNESGFDERGFNADGFDVNGFDADGLDVNGYDDNGWDADGRNADGYDENGFDVDGLHEDGGYFHPVTRRTVDGDRRDCEGYDVHGRDRDGYDHDGYGEDGYDEYGRDCNGSSRCENGDCDDADCECQSSNNDELLCSSTDVIDETGWHSKVGLRRRVLIGFEFECRSRTTPNEAINPTSGVINRAYKEHVNHSTTGDGAIAKEDGSLGDSWGLEIVTVPMTLVEQRRVLHAAFPSGRFGGGGNGIGDGLGSVKAWSEPKCGMHVHVGRSSISSLTLGKMLCFMHDPKNVAFNVEIAGRLNTTYAAYREERAHVVQGHPKYVRDGKKYSALHVKDSTVEFRIFRPSTQLAVLIKNLCYAAAVRDYCTTAGIEDLTWQKFLAWMAQPENRKTYVELHRWLQKREGTVGDCYRKHVGPAKEAPVAAAAA